MKNWVLAAALLLGASPSLAQDNSADAAPPPAATDNIGPRELSNFSLSGTVTRQAEPKPQPVAQPPAAVAREPAPQRSAATAPDRQTVVRQSPAVSSAQARPAGEVARPKLVQPGFADAQKSARSAQPAPVSPSLVITPAETPSGFSPLPWLGALLLLGAGLAIYFGLQRRGHRFAEAGTSPQFEAAQPAPSPAPPVRQPAATPQPLVRRPAPQRAARPPVPNGTVTSNLRAPGPQSPVPGLVTSSLRPWIELELEPSQAMLTDDHAAIAFDVTIFNSGSAPARDVAVEACLINAGERQDVQLSEFYTAPGEVRDKIPAVAPMARITLKSAVRLPRAAVHEYEVEGRKLFMPMVALNSRYRWSSGEGQSAASFLVGRAANDSAKLAPLRLDQGKRGWKGLAARRYEKGIRR